MSRTADQLVDDYLRRLDAELGGLPRARRREVLGEISEHIAEARADLDASDEAAIRNLLERVGDPAEIAAEARERFGMPQRGAGARETIAVILLLLGGFVGFVGWIVGLILLWTSAVWSTRDKLIGTFVLPGGLAFSLLFFIVELAATVQECSDDVDPITGKTISSTCTGPSTAVLGLWVAALVVVVLAPIATTIYLTRRMRRLSLACDGVEERRPP
jgi:uncharacterized membrane protein